MLSFLFSLPPYSCIKCSYFGSSHYRAQSSELPYIQLKVGRSSQEQILILSSEKTIFTEVLFICTFTFLDHSFPYTQYCVTLKYPAHHKQNSSTKRFRQRAIQAKKGNPPPHIQIPAVDQSRGRSSKILEPPTRASINPPHPFIRRGGSRGRCIPGRD